MAQTGVLPVFLYLVVFVKVRTERQGFKSVVLAMWMGILALHYEVTLVNSPVSASSSSAQPTIAYDRECQIYHDFKPRENKEHPNRPKNTKFTCPVAKCDEAG
jgi:hypothetical protein